MAYDEAMRTEPALSAKAYLARHNIMPIFHALGTAIVHLQPDNVNEFVVQALQNFKRGSEVSWDHFLRDYLEARRGNKALVDDRTIVVSVIGGPGSRKSSLCARLANDFGFAHLSVGDVLRSEAAREPATPESEAVRDALATGALVDSKTVLELLKAAMRKSGSSRILLDGFPRTVAQAEYFEEHIGQCDFAIYVECTESCMVERAMAKQGADGLDEDVVRARMHTFVEETLGVAHHYDDLGSLYKVDGDEREAVVYRPLRTLFSESTVCIVRPDVVKANEVPAVRDTILGNAFEIVDEKELTLSRELAERLFASVKRRATFPFLIDHMTSGPVHAFHIRRPDAVRCWKLLTGPDDPEDAKDNAPTTLRALFGKTTRENGIHCSDSRADAAYEADVLFPKPPLCSPATIVVLLTGQPGSGVHTQVARIVRKFAYTHISIGQLVREELERDMEDADVIREAMEADFLVPDAVVLRLVEDKMRQVRAETDAPGRFLITGLPRASAQMRAFRELVSIDAVMHIECPEEVVVQRKRDGDNLDAVHRELKRYRDRVLPVLSELEELDMVRTINGDQAPGDVFDDIAAVLNERTLAIIKPDAVRGGRIEAIERAIGGIGLAIAKRRPVGPIPVEDAVRLRESGLSREDVDHLADGDAHVLMLSRPNAIAKWAQLCGPENPVEARVDAASSLRALYGSDQVSNAVHCSRTAVDAERELALFFPEAKSVLTDGAIVAFIIGPPGCGMESQGQKISSRLGFVHLNVDALVAERPKHVVDANRTDDGRLEAEFVVEVLQDALVLHSAKSQRFVISAFPHDDEQAKVYEKRIGTLDFVVHMHVDEVKVLSGAAASGEMREAQARYVADTLPVVRAYREQTDRELVFEVDAEKDAEAVYNDLLTIFGEETLAMIKPDVTRADQLRDIETAIERRGFHVVHKQTLTLSRELAARFYAHMRETPHYASLVDFITSGPVIAMKLERPNAVRAWCELIGPADANIARIEAPSSLRALYGANDVQNAVHGSETAEDAKRELATIFQDKAVADFLTVRSIIVFCVGTPLSGCSSQCARMADVYDFCHLSVARVLQDEIDRAGPLADDILAARSQETSSPVSAGTVITLFEAAMRASGKHRFIIEDYPANLDEAFLFEKKIGRCDYTIVFEVPENISRLRASARHGPRDSDGALQARLDAFAAEQQPVIDYMARDDRVRTISGVPPADAVFSSLREVLEEQTLAIIKPDAVDKGYTDEIIRFAQERGFTVVRKVAKSMDDAMAAKFYEHLKNDASFPTIMSFMTSGSIVALCLQRPNAVAAWRKCMGPVDSRVARRESPYSLRALYGMDDSHNAVHGSESQERAYREIQFFFPLVGKGGDGTPKKTVTSSKAAAEFSADDCESALTHIIAVLGYPTTRARLDDLRKGGERDMVRPMLRGILDEVQRETMVKYGFQANDNGLVSFKACIESLTSSIPKLAALERQVEALVYAA